MMYQLYQAQADLLHPLRQFARVGSRMMRLADCGVGPPSLLRHFSAGLSIFADTGADTCRARHLASLQCS